MKLRNSTVQWTSRNNETFAYDWSVMSADPGPESELYSRKYKRKLVKPQPQTLADREASEADDLLAEEWLTRNWR